MPLLVFNDIVYRHIPSYLRDKKGCSYLQVGITVNIVIENEGQMTSLLNNVLMRFTIFIFYNVFTFYILNDSLIIAKIIKSLRIFHVKDGEIVYN